MGGVGGLVGSVGGMVGGVGGLVGGGGGLVDGLGLWVVVGLVVVHHMGGVGHTTLPKIPKYL